MSNDPWPSSRTIQISDIADRLMAEQAASVAKFRVILAAFSAEFDKLHFPLGSPAKGYDLADINAYVADWGIGEDDDEDRALDAARDVLEGHESRLAEHFADQRRDHQMMGEV